MEMKDNDREIWVGESRFYLDDDNIIVGTVIGDINDQIGKECLDAGLKLMDLVEGEVNIFIDIGKAGKQSSEARKLGKELFEHEKVRKVALFGLHPVARVLASFVIGSTNRKNSRFFGNKEEAFAWLKE